VTPACAAPPHIFVPANVGRTGGPLRFRPRRPRYDYVKLTDQIRNAPFRRVPTLPQWWGFAAGLALLTLILVLAVTSVGRSPLENVPLSNVSPVDPGSGVVVVPTAEGLGFGLPPEAVLVGQNALVAMLTGDFRNVDLLEGRDLPEPWFNADETLTISPPVEVIVFELGLAYRLAFEVDLDGPLGPLPPAILEVSVVALPQGWRWLPDPDGDLP
jgi:hypothetical protein